MQFFIETIEVAIEKNFLSFTQIIAVSHHIIARAEAAVATVIVEGLDKR